MKIALFGTSADPPTIAHQQIIHWLAMQQFDRVAVWASDNPFKTHGASLEQRSQMLELSIAEIQPPIDRHVKVYRNLSHRYTLESLKIAQGIWINSEFTLTVGADLIAQMSQWYRIDELLTQVKLLIVPRTGNQIESVDLQRLTDLGAHITFAPLSTPIISSTAIRNSHSIDGVSPSVAKYLRQQNLYSIIDEACDRTKLK
ncbi:nicotinate-nucleotide adenylyltransferase [Chamaesiphon sp. VAR_69_metabat_338]|uniref:nicotinate-nucleotide adenylyltransferase n=1 Tax=Chamaesiphon sp. VAR_69_metabat_338 TaxID=2964704 RepID=UPI00286E908E|nr:nicotinate-nucleotide adenylyltransferase [Chamaesiphon sp. VAR_69_metabat_338]